MNKEKPFTKSSYAPGKNLYEKSKFCIIKVLEKSLTSLSVNENAFGHVSGGFVDPLKELADPLGTLEVKPVRVVDRMGGG